MEQLSTCDLYEAGYYLLNGGILETVEANEGEDGRLSCRMIFMAKNAGELQTTYFHGKADVNLIEFRRAYYHLNKALSDAKKAYRQQLEGEL